MADTEREKKEKINEATVAHHIFNIAMAHTRQLMRAELFQKLLEEKQYDLESLIREGKIRESELERRLKMSTIDVVVFGGRIDAVSHKKKYSFTSLDELEERIVNRPVPDSLVALDSDNPNRTDEITELLRSLHAENRIFIFQNSRRAPPAAVPKTPNTPLVFSTASSNKLAIPPSPSSSSSSFPTTGPSSSGIALGVNKDNTIDFKNRKVVFFMGNRALKYDRVRGVHPSEREALKTFRQHLSSHDGLKTASSDLKTEYESAILERERAPIRRKKKKPSKSR